MIESAGKSTKIDESMAVTPAKEPTITSGESSLTKKRLFSELEQAEQLSQTNLFKPPLDDRFNSMMTS